MTRTREQQRRGKRKKRPRSKSSMKYEMKERGTTRGKSPKNGITRARDATINYSNIILDTKYIIYTHDLRFCNRTS